MVADDGDAIDLGGRVAVGGQKFLGLLREAPDGKSGGDVPEREHRVGLAATEVGLQVDDRRGVVVARESTDGAADEVAKAFREIGAPEELDRVGVVGVDLTARGDLVEVGRELGGVEVAGGDVVVGLEHLTPRAQACGFGVVDGGLQDLLVVLVGSDTAQVEPDAADLVCFLARRRSA